MNTIALVLATVGQWQYTDASRTPTPAPALAPAPPPIEIKFNENAATRDDVKALADAIAALRKDIATMKPAPQPPTPAPAPKAAATPPPRKRYELADDSGKRWWSYDPDKLIAHIARRNQERAAELRYVALPPTLGAADFGGSCGLAAESFSSGFRGMPMTFGGFSGACAGGSCR